MAAEPEVWQRGHPATTPATSPKPLPNVTLCAIDTRTPELAAAALLRCKAGLAFARTVLFSDRDPGKAGVEVVPVAPLRSAADYSAFVLKDLLAHVATEFVLIAQWDGFVLDPQRWDDAFLDWDCIGAPWSKAPPGREVGNGGFTLRSRRLLQALQDPSLAFHHPEDIAICQTNARVLEERHGIRFAPRELASRFAFEDGPPAVPTLGFHGAYNLPFVMPPAELEAWLAALPDALLSGRDGWKTVRRLLRTGQRGLALRTLERHCASAARPTLKARALLQALRLAV